MSYLLFFKTRAPDPSVSVKGQVGPVLGNRISALRINTNRLPVWDPREATLAIFSVLILVRVSASPLDTAAGDVLRLRRDGTGPFRLGDYGIATRT